MVPHLRRDHAQRDADVAALMEDVDAEPAVAGAGVGQVGLQAIAQLGPVVVVEQRREEAPPCPGSSSSAGSLHGHEAPMVRNIGGRPTFR